MRHATAKLIAFLGYEAPATDLFKLCQENSGTIIEVDGKSEH